MTDNKIENKKQWLRKYQKLLQVENRLRNKIELLDQRLQNVRSPSYSGMPRGDNPITIADLIADKMELEDRLNKAHSKTLQCRDDILEVIDNLEDPTLADILEEHFVNGNSLDRIAEDLGYSTRSIYRLYAKAIELLDIPKNRERVGVD